MKKLYVLLPILLLLSVVLTACTPPCPMDYPDGKWICEEPYMWFEVREGEYPPKGEVITEEGEKIAAEFSFITGNMWVCTQNSDLEKELFVGWNVKMSKHGKIMTLETADLDDYKLDQLYHGKYKTLTFERQD